MKGLEKSMTVSLAAVTVRSAAMRSISFVINIPTNPCQTILVIKHYFKFVICKFTIPRPTDSFNSVSVVNTWDKFIAEVSHSRCLGHKINNKTFSFVTIKSEEWFRLGRIRMNIYLFAKSNTSITPIRKWFSLPTPTSSRKSNTRRVASFILPPAPPLRTSSHRGLTVTRHSENRRSDVMSVFAARRLLEERRLFVNMWPSRLKSHLILREA